MHVQVSLIDRGLRFVVATFRNVPPRSLPAGAPRAPRLQERPRAVCGGVSGEPARRTSLGASGRGSVQEYFPSLPRQTVVRARRCVFVAPPEAADKGPRRRFSLSTSRVTVLVEAHTVAAAGAWETRKAFPRAVRRAIPRALPRAVMTALPGVARTRR